MREVLLQSVFFGVSISLLSYFVGIFLRKKLKLAIFNPLLVAIVLTIGVLLLIGVDYDSYYSGAKYLSYLLTPSTVCLAIPLYEQTKLLKQNAAAILLGIGAGVLTSLLSVFLIALFFSLDHAEYVTLLPKSITTAIGMEVSRELGGYETITVAVIVLTGVLGNIISVGVCKLFRITHPVARGIALGTSAHAIGTAKAIELGEVEGAMSGLSIAVAGLLTVIGAGVFGILI